MADHDVYRRLQRHLDRMPVGFPATESGVELRILRRLFTEQEARVALELSAIPEPIGLIARRARRLLPRARLAEVLDRMADRGVIERIPHRKGVRYARSLLAIGMYERQLTHLDADLERDVRQYGREAFGRALHAAKTPQLRTIPVDASLPHPHPVGSYEDVRAYVRGSKGPFAVMECICRKGKDLLRDSCRQTSARQTCLTFGIAAESVTGAAMGRAIRREEVLEILAAADREGLVLQPQNTAAPLFVCCCCGCCCGLLTTARQLPEPARAFSTNYRAQVDRDLCQACGTCVTRCQMDAVHVDSATAAVRETHCIGCGLCVTTCPSGAMSLRRLEDTRVPPADTPALYAKIYAERFGTFAAVAALGRHLVGGKV